ncbi:hypothetical protein Lalb_Chr08g0246251 [Lupinus albus]|uniref:Uncharacterized protein n=1 Tax=Lupinus albus TaxID=3870 RepID=A0A6A4Q673_LUPAL|nr:hypothetical protein Lalb_Chr08g0246251 [Lupinus albus]
MKPVSEKMNVTYAFTTSRTSNRLDWFLSVTMASTWNVLTPGFLSAPSDEGYSKLNILCFKREGLREINN